MRQSRKKAGRGNYLNHDDTHMSTEPSTAVVEHNASAGNSAVAIIREAMASGVSPEHMRELLAVRREWESDEARKSYNRAISDFQRQAPIIEKGDRAYDKEYARMDRIWRTIRPLFTGLGLSITWQICEMKDGMCHVEGMLAHRDGHGVPIRQDIPVPDVLKGQNKAQQFGSARTYAQRYALCGALGIVTGDDDDGHAAGTQFVTHDQARAIEDLVEACRGVGDFSQKEAAFWKWSGATCAQEIAANRYDDVVKFLKGKAAGK